jgi:putative sigma-54 modulation protein
MQVSITGRHVNITDNVKAHVEDKLERCLGLFPRIESVKVILETENREQVAEVIIQGSDHIRVAAKETSENLYDAIDRALEHAERQMRKQRDKVKDHHK